MDLGAIHHKLSSLSFLGGSNGTIHVLSNAKTTCNADFVKLPKVECFNSHLVCVCVCGTSQEK